MVSKQLVTQRVNAKMINKYSSRGDTIIEVLSAVAIFSLIAVGTMTVMNKSLLVAQRSLEITQARQQIDSQAEALRFLNSSYIVAHRPGDNVAANYAEGSPVREWLNIRNDLSYKDVDSPLSSDKIHSQTVCPTNISSASDIQLSDRYFVLNTNTAKVFQRTGVNKDKFIDPDNFSQVRYDNASPANIVSADGIWIEAIANDKSATDAVQYMDFNIWTCWYSPGQTMPVTISTKVRLYDPR